MIADLAYGLIGLAVLIVRSLVALAGMVLDPAEREWWARRQGR